MGAFKEWAAPVGGRLCPGVWLTARRASWPPGFIGHSPAKQHQGSCELLRSLAVAQVHFSVVDLELHARYTPGSGETVFDRDQAVAARTQVGSRGGSSTHVLMCCVGVAGSVVEVGVGR